MHHGRTISQRAVFGILAAGWIPMFCADQSAVVSEAIAKIVEKRDQTAEYVVEVKRRLKTEDPQYRKARDLYIAAYAKNNAWIATLKSAIQSGKTKNLGKDERYRSQAAAADEASQTFITHVQSIKTVPKSRVVPVGLVADLGVSIWSGVKEKKQQARDEAAERFAKETRWASWDAIRLE